MRRQLIPAGRLALGDVILEPAAVAGEVDRLTGSPGRKAANAAPLLRVFLRDRPGHETLRETDPVAIVPRLTKSAGSIVPGDLIRLPGDPGFQSVVRVTGSPGRRSATAAPLLRVFLDGVDGHTALRSDATVTYRDN